MGHFIIYPEGSKIEDINELVALIHKMDLSYGLELCPEYTIPYIEGWMNPIELLFLFQQAKKMNSIVEIGCWKGRSTHALASGCKGTVYALDHWLGDSDTGMGEVAKNGQKWSDIYLTFLENTRHFKNIQIVKGYASESANDFKDASIDMVFIDGGHKKPEPLIDIKTWLPKTKKLICGHDYSPEFPDVMQAVNEIFGKPDGIVSTIWFKSIQKETQFPTTQFFK